MNSRSVRAATLVALFMLAFLTGPFAVSDGLQRMPGNIGDARLNNYFLENIYQFFKGRSESLWHLGFFFPFPYVLGFSDNLFGASPVYLLARAIPLSPETAFQVWFLSSYPANFLAAYYVLRRLGREHTGSAIGALVFAFAMPVMAHSGHAQLQHRFGVPMSIGMFILFLEEKNWKYLVQSAGWLVWQFYCGVYVGCFTLMMLVAIFFVFAVHRRYVERMMFWEITQDFIRAWRELPGARKLCYALFIAVLLGGMILLFYPYLQVQRLYGFKRPWAEIASMLPRLQSYAISDYSSIWASGWKWFEKVPMRHEHQMFVGALPALMGLAGLLVGLRTKAGWSYRLLSGSLVLLILSTLYVGGVSLWMLFYKLPLASAIRAMTRIDVVLLFPLGYLCSLAIDELNRRFKTLGKALTVGLMVLFVVEAAAMKPHWSDKEEWRHRASQAESRLPRDLSQSAILFLAQSTKDQYADEIDAIWIALTRGIKTLNGYSGNLPPGERAIYLDDCSELPKRVVAYLSFTNGKASQVDYLSLMRRTVPLGFTDCREEWWSAMPAISWAGRRYTPDEVRNISLHFLGLAQEGPISKVRLQVLNENSLDIASGSLRFAPLMVSWRFADEGGQFKGSWEPRKALPVDIPSHGSIELEVPLDSRQLMARGGVEFSMVQDGAFWAHDIGVSPLQVNWTEGGRLQAVAVKKDGKR